MMMKKIIFCAFMILIVSGIYAQDKDIITEEKSSSWVRIGPPAVSVAKKQTVTKKSSTIKKVPQKKAAPVAKTSSPPSPKTDEFNKTNSKVKRFQKD